MERDTLDKISVRLITYPEKADWDRCKDLAMRTIGKYWAGDKVVTDEWKHKILEARHSPIRVLTFTIEMNIPYYVSTHFVRHKIGVEHFVQSQRNDRQSQYDRELAPQSAFVCHTMVINAEALMVMSNRRLCGMADSTTRYVMSQICRCVEWSNPEFAGLLVPQCERMFHCTEFKSCGHWENECKKHYIDIAKSAGVYPALFEDFMAKTSGDKITESSLCSHF